MISNCFSNLGCPESRKLDQLHLKQPNFTTFYFIRLGEQTFPLILLKISQHMCSINLLCGLKNGLDVSCLQSMGTENKVI